MKLRRIFYQNLYVSTNLFSSDHSAPNMYQTVWGLGICESPLVSTGLEFKGACSCFLWRCRHERTSIRRYSLSFSQEISVKRYYLHRSPGVADDSSTLMARRNTGSARYPQTVPGDPCSVRSSRQRVAAETSQCGATCSSEKGHVVFQRLNYKCTRPV